VQRIPTCIAMAILNIFILFTANSMQTIIKRKGTVVFPWQKWLRERATMYRCSTLSTLLYRCDVIVRTEKNSRNAF
jgi:hypothetical protein